MFNIDMMVKMAANKLTDWLRKNNGEVTISIDQANNFLKEKKVPLYLSWSSLGLVIKVTNE